MENKLSNFFPFSPESNLGSSFILCIDDGAFSGACAFHELLFKSLKDGKKVHIISVTHSRSHYEAVLRKQVHFFYFLLPFPSLILHSSSLTI